MKVINNKTAPNPGFNSFGQEHLANRIREKIITVKKYIIKNNIRISDDNVSRSISRILACTRQHINNNTNEVSLILNNTEAVVNRSHYMTSSDKLNQNMKQLRNDYSNVIRYLKSHNINPNHRIFITSLCIASALLLAFFAIVTAVLLTTPASVFVIIPTAFLAEFSFGGSMMAFVNSFSHSKICDYGLKV